MWCQLMSAGGGAATVGTVTRQRHYSPVVAAAPDSHAVSTRRSAPTSVPAAPARVPPLKLKLKLKTLNTAPVNAAPVNAAQVNAAPVTSGRKQPSRALRTIYPATVSMQPRRERLSVVCLLITSCCCCYDKPIRQLPI